MTALPLADLLERHELLPAAWDAAYGTGMFLRDERPRALRTGTKSGPTDVVTHMDQAAEQRIARVLLTHRPDDGLLGEEGVERPGSSGVRWVIDPIDGTVNYLYRLSDYAVSIAAEAHGNTEVGVIAIPEADEAYVAARGHGAWRVQRGRATALQASRSTDLSAALIATGFAYDPVERSRQGAVLAQLLGTVRDMRYSGAATIELARVAAGHTDGFYMRGLQPWDYTAGLLIAREGGAGVATPYGDPGLLTVAASVGILDALVTAVDP